MVWLIIAVSVLSVQRDYGNLVKKVLIFPNGGIGDAVQIYSVCEQIKNYYRTVCNAEVKVYVAEYNLGHLDILRGQKHLDDFYRYDRVEGFLSARRVFFKVLYHLLKLRSFDKIFFSINPDNLCKSLGIIHKFLDFKSMILIDKNDQQERASGLTNFYRYQKGLNEKLGVALDPVLSKICATKASLLKVQKFIDNNQLENFVVIGQDATSILKAIPDETVITLHETLVGKGYSVVYIGGVWVDKFLKFKNTKTLFKSRNIRDVAALISRSKMYWGGDSGLTHISAAVGVDTVGIYGPTNLNFLPPGENVFAIEKSTACKHRKAPCDICEHKDAQADGFGACMYWLKEQDYLAAIHYFQTRQVQMS
jgi:ADP-heptose:LPS heptosyltransferase